MSLEGRVALVTGSSRGLGRATALCLARDGADIIVAARTEAAGGRAPGTIHETAAAIEALGRRALAVRCDLNVEADVESLIETALASFGKVDILVNNAAARVQTPLLDTPPARWDLMMNINLRSSYLLMRGLVPKMLEQGWGHLVTISPALSAEAGRGAIGFNISKQSATMLTLGLARELAGKGVAANCLQPQGQRDTWSTRFTGNFDPSRLLSADVMGDAIVHVCNQDPNTYTGRALSDLDVLKEAGITDLARYRVES